MNRLSRETSPYLLQHADNPVDWYPWGEEAFEKAKALNKPILLSIGYSACHWCHVMAHESFEDKETAELMNRLFVNIKVDREERPDLDKIYQTALQVLIRKPGGWPLTMFLTPDKGIPFFGGTYFPKRAGFGWLGFQQVLQSVADYVQEHSDEINQFTRELQQALQQSTETTLDKNLKFSPELIQVARRSYGYEFDRVHGGFGGAPKFPLSSRLERLLVLGDKEALSMVVYSLEKMAKGGIYDHLGGGFCRYSVDEAWMIPHFEKMLYDNAQLLSLYAYAAIVTNRRLFKKVAVATGRWIIREMQSAEGGYYSTISADSEGKEGKFYYWDRDEIKNILTADEYAFAEKYFGLALPQNFEGHWHLWVAEDLGTVASDLNMDRKKALRLRKKIISTLYQVRDRRVHPACDKKVLTSWNALAIKGLNIAGRLLKQPDFIDSADKALDFIHRNLWREQRLLVTYKDGRAHLMAYLDDYAFMLDALLQSLQTRWSNQNCKLAIQVAEILCCYFYDEEHGGFYFTAKDHETLMYRPKPVIDDAMPAGNGVAAYALLRLGYLLGNTHYLEVAQRTLQMAWEKMSEYPTSCDSLFLALEEYLTPVTIIILRGEADVLVSWQEVFFSYYLPHHLCFSIPNDAEDLPEALQKPINKKGVSAYICQGWECQKTLHFLESFERFLLLLSRAG